MCEGSATAMAAPPPSSSAFPPCCPAFPKPEPALPPLLFLSRAAVFPCLLPLRPFLPALATAFSCCGCDGLGKMAGRIKSHRRRWKDLPPCRALPLHQTTVAERQQQGFNDTPHLGVWANWGITGRYAWTFFHFPRSFHQACRATRPRRRPMLSRGAP